MSTLSLDLGVSSKSSLTTSTESLVLGRGGVKGGPHASVGAGAKMLNFFLGGIGGLEEDLDGCDTFLLVSRGNIGRD